MAVRLHQIGNRDRTFAAQQPVERDRTEEVPALVGDVKLEEALRQFRRFAHVVDRLADVPGRRHGDELRLHAPAGGIFGIVQAAGERDALGLRQLLEDFGLLFLRQVLEDRDGVVGFELADALRHRLRRQLIEDLVAHGVVDLGQRGEVEVDAEQLDQPRALLRLQRLDQSAHVGFVQVADQRSQTGGVARLDPARDAFDESLADRAVLVARQLRSLGRLGLVLIEHYGSHRQSIKARRLYALPYAPGK